MTNHAEESGSFHKLQAERDLEANWEVDLANKLEEYLFKICSGEINGTEDDNVHSAVNFAEAALLLQGSAQVYSRKVEYLYNLVLHALEFLSQKRQQEQARNTSVQPEQSDSHVDSDEQSDQFWGLDDIPVEARNCLDTSTSKDAFFHHFEKPPTNLVVLEGDCLDATGDGGELESYLLATNDLYHNFILLDPCDVVAVNDFLKSDEIGKEHNGTYRGSSAQKGFQSPTRRSGGTARRSSFGKNQDANLNQSPMADCGFRVNNCKTGPDPPTCDNFEDKNHRFDMDGGYSDLRNLEDSDSDDDDDPWKPLNPHEQGNLKVKPFKKVKPFRKKGANSTKPISITSLFPLARMHGTVSPELTEMWETQRTRFETQGNSQSPPLYEKLRQSLINGGFNASDTFAENGNDQNEFDSGASDFGHDENMNMDDDLLFSHEKHDAGVPHFDSNESFGHEDPSSQASLEDLCRSHLDALLANIGETEKQTELAARVHSWKHKIEHSLEEQDSRPPFDIHAYGEKILDKLSLEETNKNAISFADVVKGQEKHDVARTFSALLQLVNNGDIDLDRSGVEGESICYAAVNPFHVRLLRHDKKQEEAQLRLPKKRVKSPVRKGCNKAGRGKCGRHRSPTINPSSPPNCKFSVKLGNVSGVRCTPEGKRRRRSRFIEPVDLHSAS